MKTEIEHSNQPTKRSNFKSLLAVLYAGETLRRQHGFQAYRNFAQAVIENEFKNLPEPLEGFEVRDEFTDEKKILAFLEEAQVSESNFEPVVFVSDQPEEDYFQDLDQAAIRRQIEKELEGIEI